MTHYTKNVYNVIEGVMNQRVLVKKLVKAGFKFERHGSNHDVYKRGSDEEQRPRHREVNEALARSILRKWGIT